MDTKVGKITYFIQNELEKDELPAELKEYIRSILPDNESGRWLYDGNKT